MNTPTTRLRALIDRIARLSEAEAWDDGLTPTQRAALDYLSRANRFSRAPTQVAAYLGATKGTVSQTLKTLVRKGLLEEHRSSTDRRSFSLELTEQGRTAAASPNRLEATLQGLDAEEIAALEAGLAEVLTRHLATTRGRRFGICADCTHHRKRPDGSRFCALLEVPLGEGEARQICHEFAAA